MLPFRAKQAEIDYKLLEQTNILTVSTSQYLAFSKETPSHIIEKWQTAFDELVSSGKYHEIFKKELAKSFVHFKIMGELDAIKYSKYFIDNMKEENYFEKE